MFIKSAQRAMLIYPYLNYMGSIEISQEIMSFCKYKLRCFDTVFRRMFFK